MMELRLPGEAELREAYRRDLSASFPRAELKPLKEMLAELRRGEYHPWCLFDGDALVGEAFVWLHVPGFALFDYLCVTPERRNDGLGALLIERLAEAERGNVLFGEAEIPQYAPDPALAERRLRFYLRNGAKRAEYDTCVFGVPYHTLYWAEGAVDFDALRAAHAACYGSSLPKPLFRRFIRIPWEPSMGVPQTIPWFGNEKQ